MSFVSLSIRAYSSYERDLLLLIRISLETSSADVLAMFIILFWTEVRISILELFTIRIMLVRLERISAAITSIQILTAIVPFSFELVFMIN